MENNRTAFLRWWLLFALMLFGVSCLALYDMFSIINAGDVTKISFVVFGIFWLFSCLIGYETYRIYKGREINSSRIALGWWVSKALLKMGLMGTVIGFIYFLSKSFVDIDPAKALSIKGGIISMSTGMSTALYTTIAGLVCGLLLEAQLINIEYHLDD